MSGANADMACHRGGCGGCGGCVRWCETGCRSHLCSPSKNIVSLLNPMTTKTK